MELYHSSFEEITKISEFGRFGSFLFFANDDAHYGDKAYRIDIDEDEIIDCNSFFYREDCCELSEIVEEVMDLVGCDEDGAQEYLSQREHTCDPEIDWDIQKLTAECAKKLGYRGVAVPDEHGVSYMIDMLGFESEMERVK